MEEIKIEKAPINYMNKNLINSREEEVKNIWALAFKRNTFKKNW